MNIKLTLNKKVYLFSWNIQNESEPNALLGHFGLFPPTELLLRNTYQYIFKVGRGRGVRGKWGRGRGGVVPFVNAFFIFLFD